jgi:disulfide oxidoreductase YuzD
MTTMAKEFKINWLNQPEEHDYTSALSYLSLLCDKKTAKARVKELKRAKMSEYKSKDIFRAARLPLLPVSNSHVKKDQQKIEAGKKISPLLLVRNSAKQEIVIADGYHRLCAVYSFDEDAVIPCKIC